MKFWVLTCFFKEFFTEYWRKHQNSEGEKAQIHFQCNIFNFTQVRVLVVSQHWQQAVGTRFWLLSLMQIEFLCSLETHSSCCSSSSPLKCLIYLFFHVEAFVVLLHSHSDKNEYFTQMRWRNIRVMDSRQSVNRPTAAGTGSVKSVCVCWTWLKSGFLNLLKSCDW